MRIFAILLLTLITTNILAQPSPLDLSAVTWQPLWGTAPATLTRIDDHPALRLSCNFKGTKFDRATWDRPVQLDMSQSQGITFQLLCPNSAPISSISLYFQSGDGWYATTLSPGEPGKWKTIQINRDATTIEGKPAGWKQIRTIRISAWRGKDEDTELLISGLALVPSSSSILVLRNESSATTARNELDSVCQFTQQMVAQLQDAGIASTMLSDLDLDPSVLAKTQLLILPHNPQMSPAASKAIAQYVQQGGRVMAFYGLSPELASAAGIHVIGHMPQPRPSYFASIRPSGDTLQGAPQTIGQHSWNVIRVEPIAGQSHTLANWFDEQGTDTQIPAIVASDRVLYMSHVLLSDDPANKRQLLLAMAGHLLPRIWKASATQTISAVGQIGPYTSFDSCSAALSKANPKAAAAVQSAGDQRTAAQQQLEQGSPIKAIALAEAARAKVLQAYSLAQSSVPGEHRAFWCHSAFGVPGMTWDQAIKELADNGFTAIFPNMAWGGVAFYDSRVLPVADEANQRGDQIAQCLAACRKYGVQCHVWKVNWNMGSATPESFITQMKQQGRTQVDFSGKPVDRWLCPSHPANQQLEIDAMVEIATKYDVDGIHFDYIRYPGPEGCFCPGCRQRFEAVVGHQIANWPSAVRTDPTLNQQWLDFRRQNITKVVAAVSDKVRASGKPTKISAALFSNWPVDRDNVGQDWKLWCDNGYLDFACPMDYTPDTTQFADMIRRQQDWAGKVKLYPGIGLSTWPGAQRDTVRLINQITTARRLGCSGFTIFQYSDAEAREVLPLIGQGLTAR